MWLPFQSSQKEVMLSEKERILKASIGLTKPSSIKKKPKNNTKMLKPKKCRTSKKRKEQSFSPRKGSQLPSLELSLRSKRILPRRKRSLVWATS